MSSVKIVNKNDVTLMLQGFIHNVSSVGGISSEDSLVFDTSKVSGVISEIPIADGIHLALVNINLCNPFYVDFSFNLKHSVELSFTFDGTMECDCQQSKERIGSFGRLSSFSMYNGELGMNVKVPSNQVFRMIKIRFTRDSFDRYCEYLDCILPAILKYNLNSNKDFISQCSCFLPSEAERVAGEIYKEIMRGNRNSYYIQELCADFTGMMVNHLYTGFSRIHPKKFVSFNDIKRVRDAYFILSLDLIDPPYLIDLAHMVGINDYKLKTGFRQAYGMSVHEVLTHLRLTKAMDLLKSSYLRVSDVATTVGYSNLGDFSIAFKKKFGVSPKMYKNS